MRGVFFHGFMSLPLLHGSLRCFGGKVIVHDVACDMMRFAPRSEVFDVAIPLTCPVIWPADHQLGGRAGAWSLRGEPGRAGHKQRGVGRGLPWGGVQCGSRV